jgi:catechol 2,3-dioxygenase-like lactoylglutathione lyase family enzyme
VIILRHAGIVVRDLKESLHFYSYLGFEVAIQARERGSFIEHILGFNDCVVTTVKMTNSTNTMIELLDYSHPRSDEFTKKINTIGCSHLAFTVKDLDSLYNSLVEKGVDFINNPAVNEKVKVAFCKDPNDVYLELVEEL